jgi:thiamine pyrophosphokinase
MAACFLFGAGPFYGLTDAPTPQDEIYAADGGYAHCQALGLTPTLLLGDFDSLSSPPDLDGVPIQRYPVDKDDTDTMLGLKLGLERGHTRFHLYGCTGGRMDHTLANLQALAYLAQQGAQGFLHDEGSTFTVIQNRSLALPARAEGIFSVFALGGEATGVTIQGGRYPLQNGTLSPTVPLGVSNHFQGEEVCISVAHGLLLIGWENP